MLLAMVVRIAMLMDRDACGLGAGGWVLLVFFACCDVLVVGSSAVKERRWRNLFFRVTTDETGLPS